MIFLLKNRSTGLKKMKQLFYLKYLFLILFMLIMAWFHNSMAYAQKESAVSEEQASFNDKTADFMDENNVAPSSDPDITQYPEIMHSENFHPPQHFPERSNLKQAGSPMIRGLSLACLILVYLILTYDKNRPETQKDFKRE